MTIDAVKNYTRLMAPAYEDMDQLAVWTLFATMFTTGETIVTDAQVIDIDIRRGNKKLAAYIARGADAINIANKRSTLQKYSDVSRVFPLIEEVTPITSDMVGKRLPGESVYNGLTRMERQIALSMKGHKEDLNRIIRKIEASAAESIRTGAQTVKEGAYDFYRRSTHNASAGTVWSDAANATPISDFQTSGDLIFRDGNRRPTDIIFSGESWDEFLNTTQIKNLADNRRIIHFRSDMNEDFPPEYAAWFNAGAVYQGKVKAGDWTFNMWTYPAIYDADDGTQTQYLPDGEVIVLAKQARFDRYFGPADRLEMADEAFYMRAYGLGDMDADLAQVQNAGIFRSDFFHFDAYGGNNNKALNVRTQCAPILPTTETDAIVKLTT